jgi:hypothetical protein
MERFAGSNWRGQPSCCFLYAETALFLSCDATNVEIDAFSLASATALVRAAVRAVL